MFFMKLDTPPPQNCYGHDWTLIVEVIHHFISQFCMVPPKEDISPPPNHKDIYRVNTNLWCDQTRPLIDQPQKYSLYYHQDCSFHACLICVGVSSVLNLLQHIPLKIPLNSNFYGTNWRCTWKKLKFLHSCTLKPNAILLNTFVKNSKPARIYNLQGCLF